eukprot:5238420-Prymnesium_polylepis.1
MVEANERACRAADRCGHGSAVVCAPLGPWGSIWRNLDVRVGRTTPSDSFHSLLGQSLIPR